MRLIKIILISMCSCLLTVQLVKADSRCGKYISAGNVFKCYQGNCTWWAAYKRPDLNFPKSGRDAKKWIRLAKDFGYVVNYDYPVVGSIAVFDKLGGYGHVAHVDKTYIGPFLPGKAPFDASEMGYGWFVGVATSTYRAVGAYKYQRYNATKAGGLKNPAHLAGFIYPTRTILYHRYQVNGVLVLMRKDGAIVQSCSDVDQATLYSMDFKRKLYVDKLTKEMAQQYCSQAVEYYGFADTNLGVFLKQRVGGVSFGGIGSGWSNVYDYTPPTGNYTSNGTGATEHSQPGEWEHPGYKHGVSMDETEMSRSGSGDYNRKWTFVHGEVPVVNIRVQLKNKTNHKIYHNDVTIKWFESPNHTFNPQYDHHFATDHNKKSIGPFKHHSDSDELVERKTSITHLQSLNPGVYYIYPVFYYGGEENMASEHDHGEYIKVTILPRYDVENVSFNSDKITVTVGEGLTLSATVKNNYDSLLHDVRAGFYINGGSFNHKLFYAKVFTPADLGTQSFTVPTLAPATPGSYTISMEVDDESRLAEKNENNNQRSFVLTVNPQPIDGVVDTSYGSTDPDNPKALAEELTEGHCFSGAPTTLLGMGEEGNLWEWTCQGENGGNDEVGYAVMINPEDYCHETAETATNGGWGWNPIQEVGCVPESQDFCHSNNDGSGWGWNPYTQESCQLDDDDSGNTADSEDYCHETAETATNGGWGWNPIQEVGCVPESQDFCHLNNDGSDWGWNPYTQKSCQLNDDSGDTSDPEDYCHETAETATNGGWGWNPVTQQGCLVDGND